MDRIREGNVQLEPSYRLPNVSPASKARWAGRAGEGASEEMLSTSLSARSLWLCESTIPSAVLRLRLGAIFGSRSREDVKAVFGFESDEMKRLTDYEGRSREREG